MKTLLKALIISVVGVFVIDYLSHLLFSNPMETLPYFYAKAAVYFVFSLVFLRYMNPDTHEFVRVVIGGIVVALMWGAYYNILPTIFDYYPFGISLKYLSFWGMGLFGTGLAFGTVHTFAFVGGYYAAQAVSRVYDRA